MTTATQTTGTATKPATEAKAATQTAQTISKAEAAAARRAATEARKAAAATAKAEAKAAKDAEAASKFKLLDAGSRLHVKDEQARRIMAGMNRIQPGSIDAIASRGYRAILKGSKLRDCLVYATSATDEAKYTEAAALTAPDRKAEAQAAWSNRQAAMWAAYESGRDKTADLAANDYLKKVAAEIVAGKPTKV